MGDKLEIALPSSRTANACCSNTFKIKIYYTTSPDLQCKNFTETENGGGLCWLEPPVSGGEFPFLLAQGQAINTRSYLPCQDTPSVRTPFYAKVTAPRNLTILMSGIMFKADTISGEKRTSVWKQSIPIQSYLITFVVGSLSSMQLGTKIQRGNYKFLYKVYII